MFYHLPGFSFRGSVKSVLLLLQRLGLGRSSRPMHVSQASGDAAAFMQVSTSSNEGTLAGDAGDTGEPPRLINSRLEFTSCSTNSDVAPSSPTSPFLPFIFSFDVSNSGRS